jgi:hypothetical protein
MTIDKQVFRNLAVFVLKPPLANHSPEGLGHPIRNIREHDILEHDIVEHDILEHDIVLRPLITGQATWTLNVGLRGGTVVDHSIPAPLMAGAPLHQGSDGVCPEDLDHHSARATRFTKPTCHSA